MGSRDAVNISTYSTEQVRNSQEHCSCNTRRHPSQDAFEKCVFVYINTSLVNTDHLTEIGQAKVSVRTDCYDSFHTAPHLHTNKPDMHNKV